MNNEEIRRVLASYCSGHIEHYLSLLNDKDLEMPRPAEQEELISKFEEFITDYVDQK